MAGVKGQKNPSKHKRGNQWTTGQAETIREPEVFAFKVSKDLYPRVKQEIEEKGLSKQAFVDGLLAYYYSDEPEQPEIFIESKGEISALVRDAIATSIELKKAAISREKKAKRPDEEAIARWQAEVNELEAMLV